MSEPPSVVVIAVNGPLAEKLLKDESEENCLEASEGEYPDGGLDAWLTVLGSFLICFAPVGLTSSFGTFQVKPSFLPEVVN